MAYIYCPGNHRNHKEIKFYCKCENRIIGEKNKFLEFIANLEFKPQSRIFLKPKFSSMPCCPNTSPSRAHWQMLVFPALTRFNERTTAWGYMTTIPFLKKESMNGQPKALRPIIGK